MNSILIPFMWGLFLGRTIDLTKYDVGNNGPIFDADEYDEVPLNHFTSKYFVLENAVPYDFAEIPLDIAMRIKVNDLGINSRPLESFIKSTTEKKNSISVVAVAIHRTVNRTLKTDATPVSEWQKKFRTNQTHYVHGLTYGGAAVAIQEFPCDSPADTKVVRDIIHSHLGTEGPLEFLTQERWDEVIDAIYNNEFLRGRVGAGGQNSISGNIGDPFHIAMLSFVDFVNKISNLSQEMKDVGVPLYSQLKPLRDLDLTFPNVTEKAQTVRNLKMLDPMLDDVRNTRSNLRRWDEDLPFDINEEDLIKISNFSRETRNTRRRLGIFAYDANFYNSMNESAFNEATKLYNDTVAEHGGSFYLTYKKLREDINVKCKDSVFEKENGLLIVTEHETVFTGTVEHGLEECKEKCFATIRCKSIGYTDSTKECRLYSRSTNTADVSTHYEGSGVYDRKCH